MGFATLLFLKVYYGPNSARANEQRGAFERIRRETSIHPTHRTPQRLCELRTPGGKQREWVSESELMGLTWPFVLTTETFFERLRNYTHLYNVKFWLWRNVHYSIVMIMYLERERKWLTSRSAGVMVSNRVARTLTRGLRINSLFTSQNPMFIAYLTNFIPPTKLTRYPLLILVDNRL